ncbi:MAG TPA: S8 family serine peptidase [Longimicrobiaceae bacterium]|jgi:subtilisin family serine protease|nr:S8 family serine peptidase [Longimicrobiaceae bacterium]
MRRLLLAGLTLVLAGCAKDATDMTTPTGAASARVAAVRDSVAPLYEMDNPNRVPDEYMVRFTGDVGDADGLARSMVSAHGGRAIATWKGLKGFWGKLPPAAIEALRRNPHVAYIEANTWMRPATTVQSIAYPSGNWGLDRIDQVDNPQDGSYAYDYDGTGVHIWIVDTGVSDAVSEISSRVDHSSYFSYNGTDPFTPCYDHGTHVAVMAAGSVHGVAKGATIHAARVSDDCSQGLMSTAASASAFQFIGDYAARPAVANYSAGANCGSSTCGQSLDDAIRYAVSHGVQVMVSAGNDGNDACNYSPANTGQAITVGASDGSDYRVVRWGDTYPWASNYGSCVDLFAPGYELASYSGTFAGTSAAAPLVTGVAALYLQQAPTATPASVTQYILNNAVGGTLLNVGTGSPNKLLHSRPAVAAPTVYSVVTNPSPAKQYNPFSLTINGSGFDPATVEVLIATAGCGVNYDAGCLSVLSNGSITTKTSTQLVIASQVFGQAGTKEVYVRNGRNGFPSATQQFTVAPLY